MPTATSTEELTSDLVYWLYPGGVDVPPEGYPILEITGPVDGVWTVTAPEEVTQERLDSGIALFLQSLQNSRNFETILAKMPVKLVDNTTYLGIESPTVEQLTAQVEALTRQVNILLHMRIGDWSDISDT